MPCFFAQCVKDGQGRCLVAGHGHDVGVLGQSFASYVDVKTCDMNYAGVKNVDLTVGDGLVLASCCWEFVDTHRTGGMWKEREGTRGKGIEERETKGEEAETARAGKEKKEKRERQGE